MWRKCPKTKFCGKVKLLLGVSETVTHFNYGASSRASLISTVYAKPTGNMMLALPKEDHTRVKVAAKKILERVLMHRRKLRAENKSKTLEIVTYSLVNQRI